jgi:UMF1 family MFS transporter
MTEATSGAQLDGGTKPNPRVGGVMAPAGLSWALFEFGRNAQYMLIVTYIFTPYFALNLVGGEAAGFAAVAEATTWAGVIGAITAPMLGAMMDRGGKRKPLMAVFVAMIAISSFSLWWAMPGTFTPNPADPANPTFTPPTEGLGAAGTMAFLVLGYVGYTYSELMHNAMLRTAGRPESLSAISGAGIGLGQLSAGLLLMIVVAVAIVAPQLGANENGAVLQRAVGPVVAVWLLIFVTPFFIYTPDGAPAGGSWKTAARDLFTREGKFDVFASVRGLVDYVGGLFRQFPEVMKYLVAALIFKDAISALLALGGPYAQNVLKWEVAEMGLYGIWASLFGAVGGIWIAGWLDRKVGPRRAIMLQLGLLCVTMLMALGITHDSILYGLVPAGQTILPTGLFGSLADVTFLLVIAVVAALAAANISAARYMVITLAPKERVSEFFGLFALSSTATVWLGPLLVTLTTNWAKDAFRDDPVTAVRVGFSPVLVVLLAGLALMFLLKKETGARIAKA